MSEEQEWITPQEAARRMSERAGFIVTPDDLRQLRRRKKITQVLPISTQLILYNAKEIAEASPPRKRVRSHEDWNIFLEEQRRKRRKSPQSETTDEAA